MQLKDLESLILLNWGIPLVSVKGIIWLFLFEMTAVL